MSWKEFLRPNKEKMKYFCVLSILLVFVPLCFFWWGRAELGKYDINTKLIDFVILYILAFGPIASYIISCQIYKIRKITVQRKYRYERLLSLLIITILILLSVLWYFNVVDGITFGSLLFIWGLICWILAR